VRTLAEMVLGRESDAVPRARRLVRSSLEAEFPSLSADAELVASELITNATLHGRPPVTLRILRNRVIRVEVEDQGRTAPMLLQHNPDAMTGRGLAMVTALASEWGVEPVPSGGKVVWAELGGRPAEPAAAPMMDIEALLSAWSDDEPDSEKVAIPLGPVSTDLLLAAKAHMDNVVREMTLMAKRGSDATDELIRSVTVDFAEARAEIKRQAVEADEAGEPMTNLELHLPVSMATPGERYLAALDEVDRWARSAHLLTLATPPVHRLFRRWYVQAVVDHLRAVARGTEPAPVVPLHQVLADEVSRLVEHADASSRLELLQRVTRELMAAEAAEDIARSVVDHAVQYLGVESARVWLGVSGVLRSVAWKGRGSQAAADHVADIPIGSELRGAVVFRTGERLFLRSVAGDLADFPEVSFPPERRGHLVPLRTGSESIGVLTVTFTGGELDDVTEVDVVESMADVLAQALSWTQPVDGGR
jgi:anti-sigma regulatory factor (Ser/Thr protein kinase)